MAQKRILPSLITRYFWWRGNFIFGWGSSVENDQEYHHEPHHVGQVTIQSKRLSLGIGYTWGEGTLGSGEGI